MPAARRNSPSLPEVPERWNLDAGDAPEALLDIPPHAVRDRRFEIACALTVRTGAAVDGAWHELSVLADGALQWQRRVGSAGSADGGSFDGLDYRFSRVVPAGQPLRVLARSRVHGVQRLRLVIEADEQT